MACVGVALCAAGVTGVCNLQHPQFPHFQDTPPHITPHLQPPHRIKYYHIVLWELILYSCGHFVTFIHNLLVAPLIKIIGVPFFMRHPIYKRRRFIKYEFVISALVKFFCENQVLML